MHDWPSWKLPAVGVLLGACASPPRAVPIEPAIEQVQAGQVHEGTLALETWLADHADAPVELRARALGWAAHGRTLMQEPDLALPHLDGALLLDTSDPWLHYARGTALHTMGEYAAAVGSYTDALRIDARHIKAMQWRGHTQALMGQLVAAREDFRSVLNMLEHASPADLAHWGGDPEQLRDWTQRELERLDGR